MPTAVELLRQGKREELWQMCLGFLSFNTEEFMAIQKRLLLEQLELLDNCTLGRKIMRGARPRTVEEFRRRVPLTTYADYCPELIEKREDVLPAKVAQWVRTSGRSGEYSCKWVPMTDKYSHELSIIMYGLGNLSNCKGLGDTSQLPEHPKLVYTVAPRPYMTGAMAHMLEEQTPVEYLPSMEEAESLSFEDRVKLGFKQALSRGIDYFFGLSLVLVAAADKFSDSSNQVDIRYLFSNPKMMFRLTKGLIKSKLAGRPMLPKDLWSVKGIISSGLDSEVYRDRIKELWGRYPLDVYAATEGGIIATQTWDYDGMTFVPNLNFLEFVPEDENLKWQMDHSYRPKTLLLDEVKVGENYELILTNFHGGALLRYRIGDMIRITSLRNDKLGINIPQMVFVGRADDILDFGVIRLTEKFIWQSLQKTGIAYKDWIAYRKSGESVLNLFVELKNGSNTSESDVESAVYKYLMKSNEEAHARSTFLDDPADIVDFKVKVAFLPSGTFTKYTSQKQAEGADLAHLKPPHINPSDEVLSRLLAETEEIIIVTKAKTEAKAETTVTTEDEKIAV
jgi:hypothetical protein